MCIVCFDEEGRDERNFLLASSRLVPRPEFSVFFINGHVDVDFNSRARELFPSGAMTFKDDAVLLFHEECISLERGFSSMAFLSSCDFFSPRLRPLRRLSSIFILTLKSERILTGLNFLSFSPDNKRDQVLFNEESRYMFFSMYFLARGGDDSIMINEPPVGGNGILTPYISTSRFTFHPLRPTTKPFNSGPMIIVSLMIRVRVAFLDGDISFSMFILFLSLAVA